MRMPAVMNVLEICAGAGGQALGLERAGFEHLAMVEIDPHCCATLRAHRSWRQAVRELPVEEYRATPHRGKVDLFAGGVPCPPFSRAGKRLGPDDERDLFPEALRLVEECAPRAVLLENVRGLLTDANFANYRRSIEDRLASLGFEPEWRLVHASDHGVPQLRPRALLVALRPADRKHFRWPAPQARQVTVGEALRSEMRRGKWEGATEWASRADGIAPTLVGGSKKHGGPDLGPTQARKRWAELGVDGRGVADAPPPPGYQGMPRLTVRMAGVVQGFPPSWPFQGGKTAAYRQVGNAFPPPVAEAVGRAIVAAFGAAEAEAPGPVILRRAA